MILYSKDYLPLNGLGFHPRPHPPIVDFSAEKEVSVENKLSDTVDKEKGFFFFKGLRNIINLVYYIF